MDTLTAEMKEIVDEAYSSVGTRLLSYSQLLEFQLVTNAMGRIVQSVEAFEVFGDSKMLRMDATTSYPRCEYSDDWEETIRMSRSYLVEVFSTVNDKELLKYKVWTDER